MKVISIKAKKNKTKKKAKKNSYDKAILTAISKEDFKKQKALVLKRKDRSKKGHIDIQIKHIIDFINSLESYYTTSSCAGRIILMDQLEGGKKKDTRWIFVSHEKSSYNDILSSLENYTENYIENRKKGKPPNKNKSTLWFKQESFILHVCSRTLDNANKMLETAISAGFKHSGIMRLKKKIMVEIMGSDRIDAVIGKNGKIIASKKYIGITTAEANRKLAKNRQRFERFYQLLMQNFMQKQGEKRAAKKQ